jgi:hypothetical protein
MLADSSTESGTDARRDVRSSPCTNLGDCLLDRDTLAGIGLCERAVDRRVQMLAVRSFNPSSSASTLACEGVSDLHSHGLVEREELFEELLRNDHAQTPEPQAKVERRDVRGRQQARRLSRAHRSRFSPGEKGATPRRRRAKCEWARR